MIDTNKYLDGSKLLVMEHEEAKRIIQKQGTELRAAHADLDAAKKAQATAQELADQMKASLQGQQLLSSEQVKRINELVSENTALAAECALLRKQYDPEIRAAERAEKAKELQRIKERAAQMEKELSRTP